MPYSTNDELPSNLKKILPSEAQTVYRTAFDEKFSETKDEGKSATYAWGAVKNAGFKKGKDGKWHKEGGSEKSEKEEASAPVSGNYILSSDKIEVISLSDEQQEDESVPNAKIPSFRISSFKHPFYGKLNFDDSFLRTVVDNYHSGIVGYDLAVYAAHGTDEAIGWIKDLERSGDSVYVFAHMNKDGLQMIKDKKYKYASIEYRPDYTDAETGDSYGPALVGLALTNRPFVNRQESVTVLSIDYENEELESVLPPVIVMELPKQKEDIMDEKNQVNELENKNDAVPPDVVQMSRSEFNELKNKYQNLEQETSRLKAEVRIAHIDRMMSEASARVSDGKQLAPAVIDWAKNFMKGEEVNGIKLSNDNSVDYMDAAISYLLSNVIPCTVPVESNTKEIEGKPPTNDEQNEQPTKESVDRFWA